MRKFNKQTFSKIKKIAKKILNGKYHFTPWYACFGKYLFTPSRHLTYYFAP